MYSASLLNNACMRPAQQCMHIAPLLLLHLRATVPLLLHLLTRALLYLLLRVYVYCCTYCTCL